MRDTDWSHVVKFLTPIKRSERIHPNFIFRFSFCGLGDEQAARSAGSVLNRFINGMMEKSYLF